MSLLRVSCEPWNCALQETLSLRATQDRKTGLAYDSGYSRSSTATPAQKEREGWAGPGNTGEAKEIHLRIWRLQGLQGALLTAGAPGEEGLTSGRGAGMRSAVDLPPRKACADLAGLVVRDPGF